MASRTLLLAAAAAAVTSTRVVVVRSDLPAPSSKADDDGSTMIDHAIAGSGPPVYLDGADWTAAHQPASSAHVPSGLQNYTAWTAMLPVDRSNYTEVVCCGVDKCGSVCDGQGSRCVGFTAVAAQCWLYGSVPSLVSGTAVPGVIYYGKRSQPTPSTPASPPSPVPRTINATVPGDIISDLQRAGVVKDPYFNSTWQDPDFVMAWNSGLWTYRKAFKTPHAAASGGAVLLVLDGIRMGAMIFVNDVFLGNATNAYRRYVFYLNSSQLRHTKPNQLEIRFGAMLEINCEGRYTHSNQIDWAPVMPTTDPLSPEACNPPSSNPKCTRWGDRATFGFAVWKSVYLVQLPPSVPAVTNLVPHTFYAGGHPTSLLSDSIHAGFEVRAGVELYCPGVRDCTGTVTFSGSWPSSKPLSSKVTVPSGTFLTVNFTVPHEETIGVKLWHPRGNGAQTRYNVTARFTPSGSVGRAATTTRAIGFRHVALVTMNDTDPAVVLAANAKQNATTHTGAFTMLFRVNGAAIYARGGSKIPMDLMEGRMTANAHRRLVQSAVEGRFSMIRIWGGGLYEPRAFYDACDDLGILIYHDLQFNRDELPLGSPDQWQEISHQIRRLSHHPSIAAWNGGNEMYDPLQTALDGIMTHVALHDKSRPIWPASPGCGWASGVDPLSSRPCGASDPSIAGERDPPVLCSASVKPSDSTGGLVVPALQALGNTNGDLPAGAPMVRPPGQPYPMEYHGPYFGAATTTNVMPSQWPAREVADTAEGPGAAAVFTGPAFPGWFTAEFGVTVWQSFESLAGTLPRDEWGMSTPAVATKRNHAVPGMLASMFGAAAGSIQGTGEKAFKRQLYQSMIAQMLIMKAQIEAVRSQNVFGTLFWMYNELWPTGSWGSIEYGSTQLTKGQVEGGRWKPLHYTLRATTFADQIAACNQAAQCFVRNDAPKAFRGELRLRLLNVKSGASALVQRKILNLNAGAGTVEWLCASTETVEVLPSAAAYSYHPCRVPSAGTVAIVHSTAASTQTQCQALCDANATCAGFTRAAPSALLAAGACGGCSFYTNPASNFSSFRLGSAVTADWWQKPTIAAFKQVAPPLPTCAVPEPMVCHGWSSVPQWNAVGCSPAGENCVVEVVVSEAGATTAAALISHNIQPFVPPLRMQLPRANVTVDVGLPFGDQNEVQLSVHSEGGAIALYVVLTTAAEGRFSENAFLLEGGKGTKNMSFVSWRPLTEAVVELLKSSIRVEHLAEYLNL